MCFPPKKIPKFCFFLIFYKIFILKKLKIEEFFLEKSEKKNYGQVRLSTGVFLARDEKRGIFFLPIYDCSKVEIPYRFLI